MLLCSSENDLYAIQLKGTQGAQTWLVLWHIIIVIIIAIQVTSPLVKHIVAQTHELPVESLVKYGRYAARSGKAEEHLETAENLKQIVPRKTKTSLVFITNCLLRTSFEGKRL